MISGNTIALESLGGHRVLRTLELLRGQSLTVAIDGATIAPTDALPEVMAGTQVGLRLGIPGRVARTDGSFMYPVALRAADLNGATGEALSDAVTRASLGRLMTLVDAGWCEDLPDGRRLRVLGVTARSDEEYRAVLSSLATRRALQDGTVIADIAVGGSTTIAPTITETGTHRLASGEVGILTPVTHGELAGLGVLLDSLSDARDPRTARSVYDIRAHDEQTNNVRDRYNRGATTEDMTRFLTSAGWVESGEGEAGRLFSREAEHGELLEESRAFAHASDVGNGAVARAFDLCLESPPRADITSPEYLAQYLVDEGHVAVTAEVFTRHGARAEIESQQETTKVISDFVTEVRAARSASDRSRPLAFSYVLEGEPAGPVYIDAGGRVRYWDSQSASRLMIAAAQLGTSFTSKDGTAGFRPTHQLPPTVVQGVFETLKGYGALPPLHYVGREPVLTREGRVVSKPGYDMASKAFVTLPHRDRTRWAREYAVPEKPTLAEAQAAFEMLDDELLWDFNFATPGDRARAMVYLLTCVGRPLLNGSPLFLANAADRGAGKSYLLLIGRLLATGTPAATSFRVGGFNDDETEKRLVALLMAGGRFLHCDEVPRGAKLSGLIVTELPTALDGEQERRKLGSNDAVKQTGVIATMAGNNVELGGDYNRRVIEVRLGSFGAGSPIARTEYRHPSLPKYIAENRPMLVAAAHTVLLYGLQNPVDTPGYGFSHNWAATILGALTHVTNEGGVPVHEAAMEGFFEKVDEDDELGEEWGPILEYLWERRGETRRTAADIRQDARSPLQGQQRPNLPTSLALINPMLPETAQATAWGKSMKAVLGTGIPYRGTRYVLQAVQKAASSKKSNFYFITASVEGERRIPGRAAEPEGAAA
ncbi:hypothetical protein [Curtobacterium sp. MCPF17_021]|uniref:hypothetical protein n=1 Tax=Curtobacterium sp. MCPF17_021 TaxID=2175639 RepID=UPI000DA93461|nr:hypothetical protein [Curtobacterium sp. MCPF17_021]WIE82810.1 hypothetical protein DEJ29_015695 [Curtobacterium sp. MCPF17_021]